MPLEGSSDRLESRGVELIDARGCRKMVRTGEKKITSKGPAINVKGRLTRSLVGRIPPEWSLCVSITLA